MMMVCLLYTSGQQLLDARLVRAAVSFQVPTRRCSSISFMHSDQLAGYGFQLWRNAREGARLDGGRSQFGFLFPDKEIDVYKRQALSMTNSVFAQVDSGLRGVGLDLARDNLPVIFTEVLLRPIPLCLTISLLLLWLVRRQGCPRWRLWGCLLLPLHLYIGYDRLLVVLKRRDLYLSLIHISPRPPGGWGGPAGSPSRRRSPSR